MRALLRKLTRLSINANTQTAKLHNRRRGDGGEDWTVNFCGTRPSAPDPMGWDAGPSSWSNGLTKEHFDGEVVGKKVAPDGPSSRYSDARWTDDELSRMRQLDASNPWGKGFVDRWDDRMNETALLTKQVGEPGARGSYLKDSDKAEMYKKHKENPEVYTVERLAEDYRIMRQRVHAILWLKELEEEEVKKHGELDDSVEMLLDTCPEFFVSRDREFHVASLPYKPDFKVMPEGWDGTTWDRDEDEILYQEFVRKMNFNKMMMAKKVKKCHKYRRRRPSVGWDLKVEKLGPRGKRGDGGDWRFVSKADSSSRPLNDLEKMFVERETRQRRRKILR